MSSFTTTQGNVPGVNDLVGLCDSLVRLPELAGECTDEATMEAICSMEEQLMRDLATMRSTNLADLLRKADLLVERLTGSAAEVELPEAEVGLLRSLRRDLRLLARQG
jgi:hypothetical protein